MRAAARKAGLAALSMLMVFAVAEAGLRTFGPWLAPLEERRPSKPLPSTVPLEQLGQPNVDGIVRGARYRTNSRGVRGPEYLPEPAEGVFRIVVFGDSVVMGQGVDERDAYPAQLEALLNRRGDRRYQVLNLGVSAFNARRSLTRLRGVGLGYHPDLVVYGFTVNDIEGPSYIPGQRGLRRELANRFNKSSSLLLRVLWPALVSFYSSLFPIEGSYEYELMTNYFRNEPAFSQLRTVLGELVEIAAAQEICAVLFIHVNLDRLRLVHPFTAVYDKVAETGRSLGLYVAESFPSHRGRSERELRISLFDPHPTRAGHALLASSLLDALNALPGACYAGSAAAELSPGAGSGPTALARAGSRCP